MTPKTSILRESSDNFLIDEQKLRRFHQVLVEHVSKIDAPYYISLYVERSDNTATETTDIEEALREENSEGRDIATISMSYELDEKKASEEQKNSRVKAVIGFTRFKTPKIRFGITSNDRDWAFLLADDIDTQVKRVIRKRLFSYLPLSSIDFIAGLFLFAALFAWLSFAASAVPPKYTVEQIIAMTIDEKINELLLKSVSTDISSGWLLPISMLLIAIWMVIINVQPIARFISFANRSFFLWGDMIDVFHKREKLINNIKWGIIIAFIISVLASLVSTIFLAK